MKRFTLALTVLMTAAPGLHSSQVQAPQPLHQTTADRLLVRYTSLKTNLGRLADKMPEEHYAFRPTPEMAPFAARIAHIARMNFETCSHMVGKPNPHANADLEATVTQKAALLKLLTESYALCDGYMTRLSPQVMIERFTAKTPGGFDASVELGGVGIDLIAHNTEMYGYLAVYLRLKGIVPPTSERGK